MLNGIRRRLAGAISPDKDINKYLNAFFKLIGGQWTQYDIKTSTYLQKGLLYNPDVYSIISQQARKAASIPWKVTVNEEEKEFPLKRPNPTQTWLEIKALNKMMLKYSGDLFLYTPKAQNGLNKGVPKAVYVLPSHLVKIVLNDNIDLNDYEASPIRSYMLIEGDMWTEFEADQVIHVKYANPDFDFNGSHLYGLSPLRPVLRNIQSSNEAIDVNLKTMLNSGVFGFIHGKGGIAMTPDQAEELKSRLSEMDKDPSRLGKIAGVSAEIGFQRIGLTPDELKPFEFLKFDQKTLCNALGWSDKLLNNDDGGKYDNVSQFRRQVITDDIMPDNDLIDAAIQEGFVRKFKGYEDAELISTYDHLPEMQEDMSELTTWVALAKDKGLINGDEAREKLGFERLGTAEMQAFTVKDDVIPLDEAINSDLLLDEPQTLP